MHRGILTFKALAKAISLLIASMFLFVQVASASHVHDHVEDAPKPEVCAVCLAATEDDDGDFDFPPPPPTPTPFFIPNTLEHDPIYLSDAPFALDRNDPNVLEPPNLRLSAPRAPPV